jgi:hypothetical protein
MNLTIFKNLNDNKKIKQKINKNPHVVIYTM